MKETPRPAVSLRDSEERFRILVEGARDYAIFMLDPDGRVVSWNLGAERIKGYQASEIIGEHFSRFYAAEAIERRWPEHELEMAKAEGRFEDEGWRLRKDGTRFWANVVITALRNRAGELLGFSKITRDLTDRRLQEEQLRESEERFRLLVDSVQDYAIFMLDPDGRVASWNGGARRLKGYEADEIVGQHFSRFYPPDALARGWPEHELAVARREGRFEDEGWRVKKDGSLFWANVVITAMHDPTGSLRGFAKVTRDLTERRRIEEMRDEGRRVNEFLALLGHELRNPLAPIRNAAALLKADQGGPSTSRIGDLIDRQAEHLTRIVDDLLDLGRVNTGKIVVLREPLDLAALVAAVADATRPTIDRRQQHLELQLPREPVRVCGDATRLTQVVSNLLHNANKFTPPGGRLGLELVTDGRYAELRVRDDGPGIAPELLPRVFDAFVQGDRALDRPEGGLGIGLTLVKKLVELHGGSVSAHSGEPRVGTEVVVRMPLDESVPAPAPPEPTRDAAPETAGLRVLVVDDNVDAVETLAVLVGLWGHDVRTAEDGHAALAATAEFAPDVVLLDIGLPGLDGYEVAERLRGGPATLVAMTGYGRPEDVERARRSGFARHLVKPVEPDRLRQLLAEMPRRAH